VIVGGGVDPATGRNRNGRPIVGTAIPRPISPIYTTYGGGFGWNLGYVYFNPFNYGYGYYNPWYTAYRYPFGYGYYDPFYNPYYPYSYSGYGTDPRDDDRDYRSSPKHDLGALRIKASPGTAKVYVDGTLMGVVDDFDGLSHHLELEPGVHRLELRADGYQTLSKDVTVTTSTTTVRFSLKKK